MPQRRASSSMSLISRAFSERAARCGSWWYGTSGHVCCCSQSPSDNRGPMKNHGGERSIRGVRHPSLQDGWDLAPNDPTGPRFRIEDIYPCVDCGRYPIKRIAGESVDIWADIFREGHDVLAASVIWREEKANDWQREPMTLFGNDRWHGRFTPPAP